ncbi:MAG: class I SAM-dependent methyltransferase [Chloroflexi bacterium]|nr:class I SAM-dependent methyltransferase [Chloroflexota bacterium]
MKWNHNAFFPLEVAYPLGVDLGSEISASIIGRIAGHAADHGVLAQVIRNAGNGDHLEIGSLFGGSAILAALVKRHYNLAGKLVCIDPMTGYYGKPDPESGIMLDETIFWENMEAFGVQDRVELIVGKSEETEVTGKFVSAFLDGDHSEAGVLRDWDLAKGLVSKYILLDNYDAHFEGVQDAFRVISQEKGWRCVLVYGISAVFERSS